MDLVGPGSRAAGLPVAAQMQRSALIAAGFEFFAGATAVLALDSSPFEAACEAFTSRPSTSAHEALQAGVDDLRAGGRKILGAGPDAHAAEGGEPLTRWKLLGMACTLAGEFGGAQRLIWLRIMFEQLVDRLSPAGRARSHRDIGAITSNAFVAVGVYNQLANFPIAKSLSGPQSARSKSSSSRRPISAIPETIVLPVCTSTTPGGLLKGQHGAARWLLVAAGCAHPQGASDARSHLFHGRWRADSTGSRLDVALDRRKSSAIGPERRLDPSICKSRGFPNAASEDDRQVSLTYLGDATRTCGELVRMRLQPPAATTPSIRLSVTDRAGRRDCAGPATRAIEDQGQRKQSGGSRRVAIAEAGDTFAPTREPQTFGCRRLDGRAADCDAGRSLRVELRIASRCRPDLGRLR